MSIYLFIFSFLDWSPQHPELLLAAYHSREDAPHDPDGACLIWNTRFKKTSPEYTFHCQSPVTAATFAKFHPNLVLGGTYSGQLVLWDNRSQKKTPVQRSPLTATTHTVSFSSLFFHCYFFLILKNRKVVVKI